MPRPVAEQPRSAGGPDAARLTVNPDAPVAEHDRVAVAGVAPLKSAFDTKPRIGASASFELYVAADRLDLAGEREVSLVESTPADDDREGQGRREQECEDEPMQAQRFDSWGGHGCSGLVEGIARECT